MFYNSVLLIIFLFILFLAYRFKPKWYKSKQHLIIELASQGHKYKRIVQIGFLLLGAAFTMKIVALLIVLGPSHYYLIIFLLATLSFISAGVFCSSKEKNTEAIINGISSTLTLIFIVAGITTYGIVLGNLTIHMLFSLALVILYLLMVKSKHNKGIYDRILYLIIAVWLLLHINVI